ncbi:hypothetical protein RB614_17080 [Phytohabitans sp. ZYX-F-186]|uniref:AB hydrolase-1 domain-containing protein n=1 Tax=Phytohabitans maris TaxID=3071409 RepID=A0ABU0ZGP1_9ACTN|nr:hypothetical protein [Phytohabitans sp. ZYX-F-186]MDQ7906228.1 hypothetical protein [Phytohabitans sp. ZYX-F-186]
MSDGDEDRCRAGGERGNSRSRLDGAPGPQSIAEHGDDAYRVLAAVGVSERAPAYVFGNSSGAVIGLELAARHPELVRVLVAHEPPLFELLPERDHWRGVIREVEAAYREGGSAAAGQVLGAALAMSGSPTAEGDGESVDRVPGGGEAPAELDPETAAMLARFAVNNEFFLEFEVPAFAGYVPDGRRAQGRHHGRGAGGRGGLRGGAAGPGRVRGGRVARRAGGDVPGRPRRVRAGRPGVRRPPRRRPPRRLASRSDRSSSHVAGTT